ncbi:MAG: hypothetical protein GWP05_00895 [Anaerolineaceae bacterium]|nr:hypothetical protein [Anaerolineaceae bacterium]
MLRVRLVVAIALLGLTVAGTWHGLLKESIPLAAIALAMLGYNLLIRLTLRKGWVETPSRILQLCSGQIIADGLALTALLFFCGGVENPMVILYVLPVAAAGLLLPRHTGYLVATVLLAAFAAVAVLQAQFPALHHPLPFRFPGNHFQRWAFVASILGALAAAIYFTAFVTTTIRLRLIRAEARIARSRDLLNAIISCMTEAVVFISADGTMLLENPAFTRWFRRGESPRRPEGHDPTLPAEIEKHIEKLRQASPPSGLEVFQLEAPCDPGQPPRRFSASASCVHNEQNKHLGYMVVAKDVTEQWQLEQSLRARNSEIMAMSEKLKESQREMGQREKMIAIGTMAAGVAHEIGNPLAGLSAIVQVLRRHDPTPDQREHLQKIHELVERIARIVRQLVEFARPASVERAMVDLDALIEDTLGILRYSRHDRRGSVESVRNNHLPMVLINPQQFQQVLLNLVLNGLDAIEEGQGKTVVCIERSLENGWVRVRVRDWGCGMTPEGVRQAFEPFYTTKAPNRGTGLGLAVSYRLVESQGGTIGIQSTPGEGTTVTVSFPAASPGPKAHEDLER